MAPEATAEAMKAYIEETNRLNRERRASSATDHKELADMEKKIATMIAVIEDGGYVRGMMDRLRDLEARQDELTDRNRMTRAEIALLPLRSDPKRSGNRRHERRSRRIWAKRRMRSGRLGNDNEGWGAARLAAVLAGVSPAEAILSLASL